MEGETLKKILTIIFDGFGYREKEYGNAIKLANMPNYDKFVSENPHSLLQASGSYVGLPEDQFGNSEVGHMTIGAGRVLEQQETILDKFFFEHRIEDNEQFAEMIMGVKENDSALHLMCLISDGGVHSHIKYLLETLRILKKYELNKVYIHGITDGRDTKADVAKTFVKEIENVIKETKVGVLASICGRYYAMDRDNKWDRTKVYYDLIVNGKALRSDNIYTSIDDAYKKNVTDEYLPPFLLDSKAIIKNKDRVFWLNFRSDRARQIGCVLTNPDFSEFYTQKMSDLKYYSLYEIDKSVKSIPLLETMDVKNPLGRYLGELGLTQARIAETEKYAHVTYFFDGNYKGNIDGCDKFLIPSPQVATYDLQPEMSAIDVTKKAIRCLEKDYDFILVNFANPDMVGHTGNLEASIKAVEVIDLCLGKLLEYADNNFYTVLLLSDHGNVDIMLDENGEKVTTHTMSPVQIIISDKKVTLTDGTLANVAPTILDYMDIALPEEMKDSKSLIKEN